MKKLLSILICVLIGVNSTWAGGTITMSASVSSSSPVGSGTVEVCGWDANKIDGNWIWQGPTCGTSNINSYGEQADFSLSCFCYQFETDAKADLYARPTDGYKFVSWTYTKTGDNRNKVTVGIESLEPEQTIWFEGSESNSATVNFVASFDYKYSYKHKAKAIALDCQGIPVGYVSVDMGTKKEIANVTKWSDPTATPNAYLYEEAGVSTKGVSYTFNYYAKTINFSSVEGMESMKFVFDGWYADEEGTQLVSNENP